MDKMNPHERIKILDTLRKKYSLNHLESMTPKKTENGIEATLVYHDGSFFKVKIKNGEIV